MKKTLAALLVGSMLIFPVPALAADDTINSLKFETLEKDMRAYSPLILDAGDPVAEGSDKISDGLNNLKKLKKGIININLNPALKDLGKTYTPGMKVTDLGEMGGYAPALIPSYTLATILLGQITTLDSQIESMEKQQGNMWKSWIQVEQGKDQAIWLAQQAYLSYFSTNDLKENLTANIDYLQKDLSVLQLKESLGLATHYEVLEKESALNDKKLQMDSINKGLDAIEGQLNVLLGQDYDTSLELKEPSSVSMGKINEIDYEDDLKDALVQSYDVRLQDDSDKRKEKEQSFTFAFHSAYQDILDKKKALNQEQSKLANAKTKYDQAVLTNSLGLISNQDLEGALSMYTVQVNAVDTAEQKLLQAYTAYNWMKHGLTISTTGGSASQSTNAAGGSGASM